MRIKDSILLDPAIATAYRPQMPELVSAAQIQNAASPNIAPPQNATLPNSIIPQPQGAGSPLAPVATTTAGTQLNTPSLRGPMSYVEMMQALSPYRPLTPEQQQAEEDRRRRNTNFAAMGDAISALANLWGTTHGAQNAYNPALSLSSQNQSYWDRLTKERQENQDRYNRLMLQAAQMDQSRSTTDFNRRMALEQLGLSKAQFAESQSQNRWTRQRQAQQDANKLATDNANLMLRAEQLGLDRQKLALQIAKYDRELQRDNISFNLGSGLGEVQIPKNKLGSNGIGQLFYSLPEEIRSVYMVPETVEEYGIKKPTGRMLLPKDDVMLAAIGMHASESPVTLGLLIQYAGALSGNGKTKGAGSTSVSETNTNSETASEINPEDIAPYLRK